jgi:hypothetical protein
VIVFPRRQSPWTNSQGILEQVWYKLLEGLHAQVTTNTFINSLSGAGAPTSGTTGTGAGVIPKVWLYLDETNADLYLNNGTVASPDWKLLAREA